MFKLINESILSQTKYYVYVLKNPIINQPFYIGKGQNKRYLQHFKEAITGTGNNPLKTNTIKKILQANGEILIEFVYSSNDEQTCFDKEIELIKFYGRKNNKTGILTNLTDGGEGTSGRPHSNISKSLISKIRIIKFQNGTIIPTRHSEEHRNKLRINNPGGKVTSKPISQIDTDGNVIKQWPAANQAAKYYNISKTNLCSAATKYKNRVCAGFYWRYVGDVSVQNNKLINAEEINKNRLNKSLRNSKKICQLDEYGNTIKIWNSITEASKHYNLHFSTISYAIKHNSKSFGYKWKFLL